MISESPSFASKGRPDLEEFLSALDGFLNKQSSSTELTYLKFLGIFCRSIGAGEGHLLRGTDDNQLQSVISFGMGKDFDQEFNKASGEAGLPDRQAGLPDRQAGLPDRQAGQAGGSLSPLDLAFRQKEVMAIIDLTKDPDIPPWFLNIMKRNKFNSLVAVPLLGQKKTIGVLCAYYHDVCLFDQGTMDHLYMIGRMVGVATEKDFTGASEMLASQKTNEIDEFLKMVTTKSLTKLQLFGSLAKFAQTALESEVAICGPLRKMNNKLSFTVAAGAGISPNLISQRYNLPPLLEKSLLKANSRNAIFSAPKKDWGELKTMIEGNLLHGIGKTILWQNKIIGGIIGWRSGPTAFGESDNIMLNRLALIAALALNK
ncbi:hypothetical protein BVX98_05460 [bacterium F11]|nr:hypothetical protein BVX98_05460 [bacterium F11]